MPGIGSSRSGESASRAAALVNRSLPENIGICSVLLISLLSPFFSAYSTNIKRFPLKMAPLEGRVMSRAVACEGLFHG
jgi:hypothetical protein